MLHPCKKVVVVVVKNPATCKNINDKPVLIKYNYRCHCNKNKNIKIEHSPNDVDAHVK